MSLQTCGNVELYQRQFYLISQGWGVEDLGVGVGGHDARMHEVSGTNMGPF